MALTEYYNHELYHYGIKGMKWGRRKAVETSSPGGHRKITNTTDQNTAREVRKQKIKKAVKIGAAVMATALAAYGAKKLHDVVRDKNLKRHIEIGRTVAKNLTDPLLSSNDYYRERIREQARNPLGKYAYGSGVYESSIRKNERLISDIFADELDKSYNRAKNESFGTALKNVVKDEMAKRRR